MFGWLQIDHILPVAKGGSDDEGNLCLACEFCNQYKWTQTEGIDYQTGEQVPLFNPRQQRWEDHFSWSVDGVEIIGITAIGRATTVALRLNNDLAQAVRKNWIRAGWQPQ